MTRGALPSVNEIWQVDFGEPHPGEPAKTRPAIVLGPPNVNYRPNVPVMVVPLTTSRRGLKSHVEIEATAATGLRSASYAQCELLRSVASTRLVRRLGSAGSDDACGVRSNIRYLLSL